MSLKVLSLKVWCTLLTLWCSAASTQSQVIYFSLLESRVGSVALSNWSISAVSGGELWQHGTFFQPSEPASKWVVAMDRRSQTMSYKSQPRCHFFLHFNIHLLMPCSTYISNCAPHAKPLGSWNAYSSHDGTTHSLNNGYVHRIHFLHWGEACTLSLSSPLFQGKNGTRQ